MSGAVSALYEGHVVHRRFAPRAHDLRYAMFQMLLDLDEAPTLRRRLRLFSFNRANVFSFYERDHGDGRAAGLRNYVETVLAGAGIDVTGGPIRLLCLPRLFGHVFNPLSIYYCHDRAGRLAGMLYEVNNTFGQRHSYVIPVSGETGAIRQSCDKALHVSPFMDMAMTYQFRMTRPGEIIVTTIEGRGAGGAPLILASFSGARRALGDGALVRTLFAYPLMTLKVVAAIHFEAMKLLAKGLRMRPVPTAPATAVTLGLAAVGGRHKTIKQSA